MDSFCYLSPSGQVQNKCALYTGIDVCHVIPVICHCLTVDKPAAAMDLESARLATIPLAQDSTPFKAQNMKPKGKPLGRLSSQSEFPCHSPASSDLN